MAKILTDDRLEVPHGNNSIWRYMSLEKFMHLIVSKELYFANAVQMSDKYDGTIPVRNQRKMVADLIAKGKNKEDAKTIVEKDVFTNFQLRNLSLMNCWSINKHESYALWKIYLEGSNSGIAVKSNVSSLKRALKHHKSDDEIYLGKVGYHNFIKSESIDRFTIFTNKSKYYEYEKELRLFMFYFPEDKEGIDSNFNRKTGKGVPINLDLLIDEIYISPFSSPWFMEIFKSMMKSVQPKLVSKIRSSKIDDK